MKRLVAVLVATVVIGAGCGSEDGGTGSDDGDSGSGGGGSSPRSGHVNESAVQNCIEEGHDEETCREIWTVE